MTSPDRALKQLQDSYFDTFPTRSMKQADEDLADLRRLIRFRALPWYRRAWLTLTGKAPR